MATTVGTDQGMAPPCSAASLVVVSVGEGEGVDGPLPSHNAPESDGGVGSSKRELCLFLLLLSAPQRGYVGLLAYCKGTRPPRALNMR